MKIPGVCAVLIVPLAAATWIGCGDKRSGSDIDAAQTDAASDAESADAGVDAEAADGSMDGEVTGCPENVLTDHEITGAAGEQIVPKDKRREKVPCKLCGAKIPPPR